ncbi:hypothetical protein, partial [Escherichia coli]|uniref:hypothetical protein n=1 Tax=Escherichia coli TaxID=562 RepID=UPI001A91ACBF
PRPDTACGLQAEKTGRFSLHWRDNTRPDKAFTPHPAGTKPTLVTEHNVLEGFKDIFSRLLF